MTSEKDQYADYIDHRVQGRREPNVGPETAQTWIGTLKLDGPPLELKYDVMGPRPKSSDLQKEKRSSPKFRLFFRPNFDGPPLELMGPLKTMGPGAIVPPFPPSRRP